MFPNFTNRSGRVISLSRLVLSTIFLIAIWLDPTQPAAFPDFGYYILAGYVAWSGLVLVLTWSNWRLDWTLSWPSLIVDILLFAVMVYMTEGYTSPFYTQFVFLLLSAAIRWSWRETALTSALVIIAFLGAGMASQFARPSDVDLQRFVFRGAYLLVLSLLLIWFDLHVQSLRRSPISTPESDDEEPAQLHELLALIAQNSSARTAATVWWDDEEPWVYTGQWHVDGYEYKRHDPRELAAMLTPPAKVDSLLMDRAGAIELSEGHRRTTSKSPLDRQILELFGIDNCVAAPFTTGDVTGWILLAGIPGIGVDDLSQAQRAANALERHFNRVLRERTVEEQAVAESRLMLARDLHDSVIQILSGTAFGLESMRRVAGNAPAVEAQIDRLRGELGAEQRELRGMIERLRAEGGRADHVEFRSILESLCSRVSRQWNIRCNISYCPDELIIPDRFAQEIGLLVREAAANAVKHGAASNISVYVSRNDEMLRLVVTEDGHGFARELLSDDGRTVAVLPASLAERVSLLGGQLHINLLDRGVQVEIGLPFGRAA